MNTIFFSCLLYAHTSTHPGIQGPLAFESILILLIGLESIKVGQTPFPICPGQILNARGLIKKKTKKIGQTPTTHKHIRMHTYTYHLGDQRREWDTKGRSVLVIVCW